MFNSIGRLAFALDGKNQMVLISLCWLAACQKDPLGLSWSTIFVAWIRGFMLADWSQLQFILEEIPSYLKLSTWTHRSRSSKRRMCWPKTRAARRYVFSPMPICTTHLCTVPIQRDGADELMCGVVVRQLQASNRCQMLSSSMAISHAKKYQWEWPWSPKRTRHIHMSSNFFPWTFSTEIDCPWLV